MMIGDAKEMKGRAGKEWKERLAFKCDDRMAR
jgi:hypothetical protein